MYAFLCGERFDGRSVEADFVDRTDVIDGFQLVRVGDIHDRYRCLVGVADFDSAGVEQAIERALLDDHGVDVVHGIFNAMGTEYTPLGDDFILRQF